VALKEFGVDALYVLTGQRTPSAGDFSHDEIELVSLYRSALGREAAVLAALTAGNSLQAPSASQVRVTVWLEGITTKIKNKDRTWMLILLAIKIVSQVVISMRTISR
jgi:hypothetical protein